MHRLLIVLTILTFSVGASLPEKGPEPQPDPRVQAEPTASPDQPPVPPQKPVADKEGEQPEAPEQPEAQEETVREERDHPAKDADLGGSMAAKQGQSEAPAPEDPASYAACVAELRSIGARFRELPRIDDEASCGMDRPVEVEAVLPDVSLQPEATIRCETALQLARMTRDMLRPAAKTAFPDKPPLSGLIQASGYVCRNRNSAETGKTSEHAFGNAIDIAGLRFGETEEPVMIARQDDGTAEAAFQRAFNALACLYFTTVLSPGSDATHQDHMHLDVIERKSGFRYCR
ncbi:extensin-like domain-containing protein [Rhizobium sp. G187]|uniref:extensin-like domain-containing protein n=1 Tax=Rhizobium sp. G187 TaxID=3451352 RepID=UPI003EE53A80